MFKKRILRGNATSEASSIVRGWTLCDEMATFDTMRLSSTLVAALAAADPRTGNGTAEARVREIMGASILKRCSWATVDSWGRSMAGARNMYENG